jgi:hypothetical protein
MKPVTIRLDNDVHLQLQAIAMQTNQSLSAVVREALTQYVAGYEVTLPRSIGIFSSGRIQATKLEEWLAENWRRDW